MSLVGGRLSYLNKVARSKDMIGMARHLLEVEKGWLLSQIGGYRHSLLDYMYLKTDFAGLIPDCDDDVMDEVSSAFFMFNQ